MVRIYVRLADIAVVALSALLSFAVYVDGSFENFDGSYGLAIVVATLLTANIFPLLGFYDERHWRNWLRQLARPLLAWMLVLALLIVAAFITKNSSQFSRGWVILWFGLGCVGLLWVRLALRIMLARWAGLGRLTKTIAIVGANPIAVRLVENLRLMPSDEMELVGIYDDAGDMAGIQDVPYRGTVETLLSDARQMRIDQVVVALPWSEEAEIIATLKRLWALPVDIRLAPDLVGFRLAHCSFGTIGNVPVINVFDRPLADEKMLLKRLEDYAVASAMLLVLSPAMLIIAALVKLTSRGPVLFRQPRYGFNNQRINVYKFRTMYTDYVEALGVLSQATRKDPRVTAIGRFLRRTSLDELPQLFNVLNGTMSLVGPRPHADGTRAADVLFEDAVAEYAARHRVKPGLTGWAQVNGWRGETDTLEKIQRRVEHDLFYIENWSLRLDIKILLLTLGEIVRRRNAW
ncbi:MAG: undecaprenyl-phosphate glucose phosphotransferase [Rhodospirillales bacterium]